MSAPPSRLRELIDLAHEASSERRRELLRGLTDAFFARDAHAAGEMVLFDDILTQLSDDMETVVRADLSHRMARRSDAPAGLLRRLVHDDISVAGVLLTRSKALSDEVLMDVARSQGQEHLKAISGRSHVSASVSDVIVQRADDTTLSVLIRNDGADLSREAHETIVDRAVASPGLREAVIERRSLPVDLLNELYFVAEARLRERILARNAEIDPQELERALENGRKRLATQDGALPSDYAVADAEVRSLHAKGELGPRALAAFLRERRNTRFLASLALLARVDFHTARRVVERREMDALAIICKAASFDASLFLTFAVLILDREADAMGRAREYGQLYADLPEEVAQRTIRFWRMRRQSSDLAAA